MAEDAEHRHARDAGYLAKAKGVASSYVSRALRLAATAALAELALRRPDQAINMLLREKTKGIGYDFATLFKMIAALSSPNQVIEELERLLSGLPLDPNELQLPRWVPAMVRRIESDADLQAALGRALVGCSLPSEQASFAALLTQAGALDAKISAHIERVAAIARQDNHMPAVEFDLVAQAYRVVEHVYVEALP